MAKKKILLLLGMLLLLVTHVSAATTLYIGDNWHPFSFSPCNNNAIGFELCNPPYCPEIPPSHVRVTTGGFVAGYRFSVYDGAMLLGDTSWVPDAVNPPFFTTNPDTAYAGNHYSRGCFNIPASSSGIRTISIIPFHNPWHPFCEQYSGGGWIDVKTGACPPFAPDLQLIKTVDKVEAVPGSTLTYTVMIRNIGTAKAVSVRVVDTFPGGDTEIRALPDLDGGQSKEETFSYTVPANTPDGVVLTNSATVTGTDEAGNPDTDPANNGDDASTTIHRPEEPVTEFPSVFLPVMIIIGFLGTVLLIRKTREQ